MVTTVTVLLAALVLGLLAVAVAYVLGWANQAFHVKIDPRVLAVIEVLPEVNCGACGFVGCGEYAEAVAAGKAPVDLCAPGGESCARQVAEIMGVSVEPSFPYRAVVHCAARTAQRLGRNAYAGEPTCAAANLVADVQGCTYGCLGFGDCERACPYDAIHVLDGLATVDYDKCIGCKRCAAACPRNIITMVPFKAERMIVIACSNKDFGPEVKEVCEVGCIGCKACSKHAGPIEMAGHLPIIDYNAYVAEDEFAAAREKCPRESLISIGRPTAAQVAAVADEELPERVEADFKTTVDDTEWRG